jgi:hypothetical protein
MPRHGSAAILTKNLNPARDGAAMDFTVNRIRGLRAWRRGLLAALVALLLAACGGTSAQAAAARRH